MKYYYFPVLKTRPAEILAYENLDPTIKNGILPIIELTGALGYTYPKNYRIENLRGTKRPGDISKKRQKILDLMEGQKFILDITDDESLKYYGLSEKDGGLLDPSHGYQSWRNFLTTDEDFKKQVIPTIQFNTKYVKDLLEQMKCLAADFTYITLKLPMLLSSKDTFDSSIVCNNKIQEIIDFVSSQIDVQKLILILDFGYISDFNKYQKLIVQGIQSFTNLSQLRGVILTSSSYPNFVVNVTKPIHITENEVSSTVIEGLRNSISANNIFHGDYAGIHPTKYEIGGGGWIPRIDYVVRSDDTKVPKYYDYERGNKRNTSSEYGKLARQVIASKGYQKITELDVFGDLAILNKANNQEGGNVPSYWIAVRSNIYMTMQYLYLKQQGFSLDL